MKTPRIVLKNYIKYFALFLSVILLSNGLFYFLYLRKNADEATRSESTLKSIPMQKKQQHRQHRQHQQQQLEIVLKDSLIWKEHLFFDLPFVADIFNEQNEQVFHRALVYQRSGETSVIRLQVSAQDYERNRDKLRLPPFKIFYHFNRQQNQKKVVKNKKWERNRWRFEEGVAVMIMKVKTKK